MKTHVLAGSAILYHGTTSEKAVEILQAKQFLLSPAVRNDTEQAISPDLYYLSTARSITSHYFRTGIDTIFELDGVAIGQNHRIKPVDYFYYAKKYDPSVSDLPSADETEDRVLSKHPFLSIKYVKAVHTVYNKYYSRSAQLLKRICMRLGIPIYFYRKVSIKPEDRIQVPLTVPKITPRIPLPDSPYWHENMSKAERSQYVYYNDRKKSMVALLNLLKQPAALDLQSLRTLVADFSSDKYRQKYLGREIHPKLAILQSKILEQMRKQGITPDTLPQYVMQRSRL